MSANIKLLALAKKLSERVHKSDEYLSLSLILSASSKGKMSELNENIKNLLNQSDLNREDFISAVEKIVFDKDANSDLRDRFDAIMDKAQA